MMFSAFPVNTRCLFSSIFRWPSHAISLVSLFAGCGFATPSAASCKTASWSAMQPFMESFVLDPTGILQVFPSGGEKMFYGLKDYLAADTRLVLPSVIKLIRTANSDQKKSIGHALGATAYQCRLADPETTQRIEINTKKIRDQIVLRAYSSAMNEEDDAPVSSLNDSLDLKRDWPGNSLSVTAAPNKTLGANSFKIQLWDPAKQDGGNVSFLPAAH